ncbi:hypothetical protein SKAU_G00271240 [Synaphobranchus kaupii]|uniref:Uncharacterized protein n=1 Tax=Synaphobranchus kaupii TaxID=118154 RepID=A0A9Q1F0A9_SYNKA|nr:hypothetical protein SKAU_G00271240 [Synaphobranchus kaupii]
MVMECERLISHFLLAYQVNIRRLSPSPVGMSHSSLTPPSCVCLNDQCLLPTETPVKRQAESHSAVIDPLRLAQTEDTVPLAPKGICP